MSRKIYSLILIFSVFVSGLLSAQVQKGQLVDGIAAVIGDEIVLESDITEQENFAKQQGAAQVDRCDFLENVVNNKLLIYYAKKDTLIENRSAAIKAQANEKYNYILSQSPDERTMLNMYKFRTSYEMKNAIEKISTDEYYGQAKYARITQGVNVTPSEVTDFYNAYRTQLPEVKDEVVISQIVRYPKLSDAHRNEIIGRLNKIKEDIKNGESFENMARIYSDDPGSASTGGLYKNVAKGKMVKPFEAAALNLQEGEISEPVESDFGFHIIQLVKKSGKFYDARHILLKAEPNAEEIGAARKELDSIRTEILAGKLTFKEAAFKFSDDKATKFNAGVVVGNDGSDRLEKLSIPANLAYQIAGLNKDDITDVFEDELGNRKVVSIIKINEVIPQHTLDIDTDFERIKQYALNKKRGDLVEKWVKQQIPDTFISIDNRYKNCDFKLDWLKNSLSK